MLIAILFFKLYNNNFLITEDATKDNRKLHLHNYFVYRFFHKAEKYLIKIVFNLDNIVRDCFDCQK